MRFSLPLLTLALGVHAQTVHYKKPSGKNAETVTEAQKTAATMAYRVALGKFCPKQRLQLQSAEGMNLQVQAFDKMMSPPQTQRYHVLVGGTCELTKPTAACTNTVLLVAAQEGKYLDRFATSECQTGIRCSAQGKCVKP